MPKLATLLQTSRAMGITFVPYARFRVQTRLSPEDCAARLQAVTQPQKLPTLFSARTPFDRYLLLKGQITRTGFLAAPVDNKCLSRGKYDVRGAQPFWLRGRFQPAFGGTDIVVQVFPSLLGLLTACMMLIGMSGASYYMVEQIWSPHSTGDRYLFIFGLAVFLAYLLFLGATVALTTSFQAYKMKNALRQLLSEARATD